MPIYEYVCRSCDTRFEVKQSFSDAALTVHDGCGGELRKVFQPAPIVFKGSGWYVTDSRHRPKEESPSAPSSSTKSDSTSPAKPDKPEKAA
ncbi:MAG TPA: FmdB family zinc ribbon protein [Chloroflexota bacterium]|jgi:putative FmdB family regulatory protein|nr:FmdB family zinc ribbon protein [Chloroflexota bacterium]